MTDLTDKWEKGDLPAGDYWCEITESPYIEKVYLTKGEDFVIKILAPVPSFEQWQAKLEENARLKELLKECRVLFNRSTVDGEEPNNGELIMILTKIEEALE